MNELNSIQSLGKTNHYADLKDNAPKTSSLHSIPASSLYKHSGMNALGTYNQASVSFEGFGFFNKLADKFKEKKAQHQEKKAEKLQAKAEKKAEKLQAKSEKAAANEVKSEPVKPETKQAEAPKSAEKAEEVKAPALAEETSKTAEQGAKAETKPASDTKLDLGFYPASQQMKYLKMEDPQTGKTTLTWYNPDGSIKWVQEKELGGKDSYINFYDKDGQMPREEFVTMTDGKHQYIRYRKNGLINSVTNLEEDNKTIVDLTRYHYKENSRKLDNLKTNYADGTSIAEWYRDNGSVEVRQYAKDKILTKTLWYYEDGKSVKTMHTPLENGGLERTSYAKDGRILVSDRTKPDKTTTDEITNYFYNDVNELSETITTTSDEQTIKTWYGENETAVCTKFSQNNRDTKTVWYFANGETPRLEELYLEDGKKQTVNFDESERWLDFSEFDSKDSTKASKFTKFFYKGDSEVPHYSSTTYSDGKIEKAWYDSEEKMTCKQTEVNGVKTKLEWFNNDGVTPKLARSFASDGSFKDQKYDEAGQAVAA